MAGYVSHRLTVRGRDFDWGSRTYVMGVINVSLDSFSGDGLTTVEEAVGRAKQLAASGADLIDVGGQSTRPDYKELTEREEIERVQPVIRAIVAAVDLPVSVDTYRSQVAASALQAGANMVNDITGFRRDPAMARLVAGWRVPAVIMHNQRGRRFTEVIGDITAGFKESLALADDAEVKRDRIILDPGFGFGWSVDQNFEMLRRLRELRGFGLPLLVGTSRKSSIGAVLDLPEDQRSWGTAASVTIAVANGADMVRVHDVAEMVQVCKVADAIVRVNA